MKGRYKNGSFFFLFSVSLVKNSALQKKKNVREEDCVMELGGQHQPEPLKGTERKWRDYEIVPYSLGLLNAFTLHLKQIC